MCTYIRSGLSFNMQKPFNFMNPKDSFFANQLNEVKQIKTRDKKLLWTDGKIVCSLRRRRHLHSYSLRCMGMNELFYARWYSRTWTNPSKLCIKIHHNLGNFKCKKVDKLCLKAEFKVKRRVERATVLKPRVDGFWSEKRHDERGREARRNHVPHSPARVRAAIRD